MSKRKLTPFRRKYLAFQKSEYRRKVKLQAIEYKGGKCSICGYNKSAWSMVFHHLDSSKKDFGIGSDGVYRPFSKIKSELDKCILICSNCHGEIHEKEALLKRDLKEKEIKENTRKYSKVA